MAGFLFIMKKVKNVACYYNQQKRIRESLLMKCERSQVHYENFRVVVMIR